eukprot:g70730.t1
MAPSAPALKHQGWLGCHVQSSAPRNEQGRRQEIAVDTRMEDVKLAVVAGRGEERGLAPVSRSNQQTRRS